VVEPLRIHSRLAIPPEELLLAFARAGGPGGQNVNKVETKAVLRWSVAHSRVLSEEQRERLQARLSSRLVGDGELLVQASRYRERGRNVEDARERLAELVRSALTEPRSRRATRPTRASKERRLQEKRRRSGTKRERRSDGD
jgi:ribosome-associated protein